MQDRVAAVAENLQRLREANGLSLSQVADLSGVAKATLYKVERGRTNPTLDTLAAIADSLSVEIEDLIALPRGPVVETVRAGEGQDISDDESIGSILSTKVVTAGTIEIHEQSFHAAAAVTSISHGQGAREHVFVRRGTIAVGPVGFEVSLAPGDYATYLADRPHVWRAGAKRAADIWIVHTFQRTAYHAADDGVR